jgi:hypothetical protein
MDHSLRNVPPPAGTNQEGLLLQMRSVLRRTLTRLHLVGGTDCNRSSAVSGDGSQSVVLPFPIRGEALLVRLAELLRDRLAAGGPTDGDPFVLTLSRRPRMLLSIDRSAYVEFHADSETFHLIMDVTPNARVTLETGDFDTLVRFVLRYVAEQRHDGSAVEVAS